MSLQRGANIRGWEGVTRNMAINDEERAAWRFSMFSMMLTFFVTGIVAYVLSQSEIPTISKALMGILVLVFSVVLVSGIHSTLTGGTARRAGNDQDAEAAAAEAAAEERRKAAAQAAAHAAQEEDRRLAAEAAARAAQEEEQRLATAARAAVEAAEEERRRAAAEAAARAAQEEEQRLAAEAERQRAEAEAQAAAAPAPEAPASEAAPEGTRPEGLDGPRGGIPDDLKLIKGVGPKLEALCNSLGFWHFDQIAAWSADEVAWVDENLEGFKGRVTRDDWVSQADILAKGGTTEFAERQKDA